MHEIDEDSPLFDIDFSCAEEEIALFAVTLQGHDATYGQTTFASHSYVPGDIRVGHRFVDVLSEAEDGRILIDFTEFHRTQADEKWQGRHDDRNLSSAGGTAETMDRSDES